jgi:hypothetical protein
MLFQIHTAHESSVSQWEGLTLKASEANPGECLLEHRMSEIWKIRRRFEVS